MREAATHDSREVAALLRARRAEILDRWEAAVRQLPRARHLTEPELRDHVPDLLDRLLLQLESGEAPAAAARTDDEREHALHRLAMGFDAAQVVAELAVLRRIVMLVWSEQGPISAEIALEIGRVLDEATAASVEAFSRAREAVFLAFDRLSRATVESRSVEELLGRLLRAVVETAGAIDTATVLLRDGDVLRARASVGLEEEVQEGFQVRIGEGFAGRIAAEKRPHTLRAAASDPLVKSAVVRARGLRALHGVPLLDRGELLGVANVGSVSVYEFSEWDRRLFESMASRAAAGIALHLARERAEAREQALAGKEAELRRVARERERAGAVVEALFQHAPIGLGVWDRELRYQRVNQRLAEMNGLPPAAHLGRRPSELLPDLEGVRELETRWREVLRSGRPGPPTEMAGETPAQPGVRRTFFEQSFPVRDGDDVVGVGAVVLDTTEQKRAEDELAFLAEASRELADWLDPEQTVDRISRVVVPRFADWCSVVLLGEDGRPRRVSLHADDEARAAEGRRIAAEFEVDESDGVGIGGVLRDGRPRLVASVADAPREQRRPGGLVDLLARLGIRSYLAVPLVARGRTLGALALGLARSRRRFGAHDLAFGGELARRCAVAIDNARLFQEARREGELRQRVLAVVSHDLRNPLSAILMSASRIEALAPEGDGGERLRRAGDTIRRSAERMNRLIGDLLDVAAIQAGRLAVHPEPQAIEPLLREVADAFQAAAREKRLALEVDAPADLPLVLADHDRIVQVLGNLVGNAVKATETGRIVLSARPREGVAELSVRDTGPGIPPEVLPRLFDPYVRGDDANYRGTGLGLSIVKGIVSAHGGEVSLDSEPGRGTTFRFTLPLARPGG